MTTPMQALSMTDYLALPWLSAGLCHLLLDRSPFHARHEFLRRPEDDNDAADVGTAIHDVLLEGRDRIEAIDAPDWRTKAAKEARDRAREAGLIPLLRHKVANVYGAVEAAQAVMAGSEFAMPWASNATVEHTLIWKDVLGTRCKIRPDWLSDTTPASMLLIHVKTTLGSARPESWIRNHLVPAGYDVAAAFYGRGCQEALDMPCRPRSVFLVVEQREPWGCSLIALAPAAQAIAELKVERAIRIWADCEASGKWPCYPTAVQYAEPTAWQFAEAQYAEEDHAKL